MNNKKKKIHKESKRVAGAIKSGGTPTFSTQVNVGAWKTFNTIVTDLVNESLETVIMLGSVVENSLYLAVIIPEREDPKFTTLKNDFLKEAIKYIENDTFREKTESMNSDWVQMVELKFQETSEQTPFKAIDMVFSTGSAYLRKIGVIEEEEEEYEYGFDDI